MFFSEDWGQWVQLFIHGAISFVLKHQVLLVLILSTNGFRYCGVGARTTDMCEVNGFYDDDECTTYSICESVDPLVKWKKKRQSWRVVIHDI